MELAAHMLVLGEKSSSLSAARNMARKALQDGTALAKFSAMCKAQGATVDVVKDPSVLAVSAQSVVVTAPKSGAVVKIDGETMGMLLVRLGGGRLKTSDTIDASVGFRLHAKLGQEVKKGAPLATMYYNSERLRAMDMTVDDAAKQLTRIFTIAARSSRGGEMSPRLIKKVIG
jgi:thymidine phosphorylase